MRCGIRNEQDDNDISTYSFCFLVFNENWRHNFSVKFDIIVRCYTAYSCFISQGYSFLFEIFTSFCLISLEINLQENACKNTKLLNFFSHHRFFFLAFILGFIFSDAA